MKKENKSVDKLSCVLYIATQEVFMSQKNTRVEGFGPYRVLLPDCWRVSKAFVCEGYVDIVTAFLLLHTYTESTYSLMGIPRVPTHPLILMYMYLPLCV